LISLRPASIDHILHIEDFNLTDNIMINWQRLIEHKKVLEDNHNHQKIAFLATRSAKTGTLSPSIKVFDNPSVSNTKILKIFRSNTLSKKYK